MNSHEILFPEKPYSYLPRARAAVADEALQQAVGGATTLKEAKRREAFAREFGDHHAALVQLAGEIKRHTLENLDYYVERFIRKATAAGVVVHFAEDAAEAREIVQTIAREKNCQRCVKAKSMVTEEIQLVPALEAIGCETVETDLAEFILQIDGDAPSHIVTAMMHKDRKATGRAMHEKLGMPYCEEPEKLSLMARDYLRDKFRKADLGISGGNMLVAETGTLVLCTNEGNGRMSTAVPPVHVAVVGIEKLVPTMEHAGVLLKMLARSSTGQPLTVYTQFLTGPKREGEHGGPSELHIVLLDHRRTQLLAGVGRELLACIKCGACLNACPVYRKTGGHAYGAVYCGPIGAAITPTVEGVAAYPDLAQACTLCGACLEVCPTGIDLPGQLRRLRGEMVEEKVLNAEQRKMLEWWAWVLISPQRYRWAIRLQRWWARWPGASGKDRNFTVRGRAKRYVIGRWFPKMFKSMPGGSVMQAWLAERDLPAPSPRSFRDWWSQRDV